MKNALVYLLLCLFQLFATFSSGFAAERFINNRDGTITDTEQGLMWSVSDNQGDINWHQADKWVRFTFPLTVTTQFDNWRLPTLQELQTLYLTAQDSKPYKTGCGHLVVIVPGISLTCGWVWSSETRSISAKAFNFARGHFFTERMTRSRGYRALAVRNIE